MFSPPLNTFFFFSDWTLFYHILLMKILIAMAVKIEFIIYKIYYTNCPTYIPYKDFNQAYEIGHIPIVTDINTDIVENAVTIVTHLGVLEDITTLSYYFHDDFSKIHWHETTNISTGDKIVHTKNKPLFYKITKNRDQVFVILYENLYTLK